LYFLSNKLFFSAVPARQFLREIYELPDVPVTNQLGLYHLMNLFWEDVLSVYHKTCTGNYIRFTRYSTVLRRTYLPIGSSPIMLGVHLVCKYELAFANQMKRAKAGLLRKNICPEYSLEYFGEHYYNETLALYSIVKKVWFQN